MAENFGDGARRVTDSDAGRYPRRPCNRVEAGSAEPANAGSSQARRHDSLLPLQHATGGRVVRNHYSCRQPFRRRQRLQKLRTTSNKSCGESIDDSQKALWREGLRLIDVMSQHYNGKTFVDATPERGIAVLTVLSDNMTT